MKTTQLEAATCDSVRVRAYRYHLKGLTCKEIGKLLDLSPRTVERYSQQDNWKAQTAPTPIQVQAFNLHQQGLSYSQIAQILKVEKSTVYNYLKAGKKEFGTKGHFK